MSYFYKHNFVSPIPLFSKIKEELRSYFEAGQVDDTLFPVYVKETLHKMGRSSYPVNQMILYVDGFKSDLPEDFKAVREAWMCTTHTEIYNAPNYTYTQIKSTSANIYCPEQEQYYCRPCELCQYPDVIEAVYKTSNEVFFQWKKSYLLTPGNITSACEEDLYCANRGSMAPNSYDIRGGKFVTSFREGNVYLQYYSTDIDGEELIPEKLEIQNYIRLYIKARIFEQLWHQNTDETYNQSFQKFNFYDRAAGEAFIIATTEEKKEDAYRRNRAIKRMWKRNNKYRTL